MQTSAYSTVHLKEDEYLPIVSSASPASPPPAGPSPASPTSATLVMSTPTPGTPSAPWS